MRAKSRPGETYPYIDIRTHILDALVYLVKLFTPRPGSLYLHASKEGFLQEDVIVQVSETPATLTIALSLSPKLVIETELRLVMNWGRYPSDLDLHTLQIDKWTLI